MLYIMQFVMHLLHLIYNLCYNRYKRRRIFIIVFILSIIALSIIPGKINKIIKHLMKRNVYVCLLFILYSVLYHISLGINNYLNETIYSYITCYL